MTLVRNETQRHSAALKIAGQNPVVLLPLDSTQILFNSFTCAFAISKWRVPHTCNIFEAQKRENDETPFFKENTWHGRYTPF